MLEQVKTALEQRGYAVQLCQSAQQAREYILSAVAPEQSVGIGGSVTVQQLELDKALAAQGSTVYWHWADGDKAAALRSAMTADVYLSSANAITAKGQILNIDGNGNRVAAMIYGPGKVILVVGKNKLAADYDTAMERIKTNACPANARRLGRKTPCATLGYCTDCSSPDRFCNAVVVLERPTACHPMEVVLVNEDLGY